MKKEKEIWYCWKHGDFFTKSVQPKCPVCKTKCVKFMELASREFLEKQQKSFIINGCPPIIVSLKKKERTRESGLP